MKQREKLLFLFIVTIMLSASIPHFAHADLVHNYLEPQIVEVGDHHLLIYEKLISEGTINRSLEIGVRPCYLTVTEFKTEETEEVILTSKVFDINDNTFDILQFDMLYIDGRIHVFFAAENRSSNFVHFYSMYSDDGGEEWSDFYHIANSTIEISQYNTFAWFASTFFRDEIILAFSHGHVTNTILRYTETIKIEPSNYSSIGEVTRSSTKFGFDFDLYSDNVNNVMYVASTYSSSSTPTELRISHSLDGVTIATKASVTAPFELANYYYPTLIKWNDGLFVVAQILSNTTIGQVHFYETFLWSVWVEDVADFTNLQIANISTPSFDRFYEDGASLSTYKDNIMLCYERGGSGLSNYEPPDIDFFFSKNGEDWTVDYLGTFTPLFNPATIFFAITIVLFACILIGNFIYSKSKKK